MTSTIPMGSRLIRGVRFDAVDAPPGIDRAGRPRLKLVDDMPYLENEADIKTLRAIEGWINIISPRIELTTGEVDTWMLDRRELQELDTHTYNLIRSMRAEKPPIDWVPVEACVLAIHEVKQRGGETTSAPSETAAMNARKAITRIDLLRTEIDKRMKYGPRPVDSLGRPYVPVDATPEAIERAHETFRVCFEAARDLTRVLHQHEIFGRALIQGPPPVAAFIKQAEDAEFKFGKAKTGLFWQQELSDFAVAALNYGPEPLPNNFPNLAHAGVYFRTWHDRALELLIYVYDCAHEGWPTRYFGIEHKGWTEEKYQEWFKAEAKKMAVELDATLDMIDMTAVGQELQRLRMVKQGITPPRRNAIELASAPYTSVTKLPVVPQAVASPPPAAGPVTRDELLRTIPVKLRPYAEIILDHPGVSLDDLMKAANRSSGATSEAVRKLREYGFSNDGRTGYRGPAIRGSAA